MFWLKQHLGRLVCFGEWFLFMPACADVTRIQTVVQHEVLREVPRTLARSTDNGEARMCLAGKSLGAEIRLTSYEQNKHKYHEFMQGV